MLLVSSASFLIASIYYFMMVRLFLSFSVWIFGLALFLSVQSPQLLAQGYANEWIQPNLAYYKIKVGKDALYRIPYSTLQAAGLPADATGYHLYRDGVEVPIYISGNVLGDNEYIEFYGKRNDGSFDTRLYEQPDAQPSPYKSLLGDTAAYFLVWQPAPAINLFAHAANDISNAPPPMPYFMHQQVTSPANTYSGGRPLNINSINYNTPFFDEGEGWVSLSVIAPNVQNYNVNTPAIYSAPDAPPAEWRVKVIGRSNDPTVGNDHHLQVLLNNALVADTAFADYAAVTRQFSVATSALSMPQTQLRIAPVGDLSANDAVSTAYFQVTYPRLFDFGNQRLFEFYLPHNDAAYLEIANFNGETAPVLYDLSNLKRILPVVVDGVYKINLEAGSNTTQTRHLVLCNTSSPLSLVTVGQLQERQFVDYTQAAQQGNYIIISHPNLAAGDTNYVAAYADYRRSTDGGGYRVVSADIETLYDQFAYGIAKHPLAIANFLHYAANNFDTIPTHLLLLGKAIPLSEFGTVASYHQCLVPTYGMPPSDILLDAYDRNQPLPQVAIGRVPASNSSELRAYWQKVKDYEAEFTAFSCADTSVLWRRKVLGLATHNDPSRYADAVQRVRSYADSLAIGAFAADTLGVYGQLGNATVPLPQLGQTLENGVGLLFFAGTAEDNYWRMDVEQPSAYNNTRRYPFVVSQSDFIGNIHQTQNTMASDYVLADGRGAIGFIDNVYRAFPDANHQLVAQWIARMRGGDYENSVGTTLKNTIGDLYGNGNPAADLTALSYTLAADPALSIVPAQKPELQLNEADITLYTPSGIPIFGNPANITASMSHFEARLQVWSIGKNIAGNLANVRVTRWLSNGTILPITTQQFEIPRVRDTISLIIPNDLPINGISTFLFSLDFGNEIAEMCETNNSASRAANVVVYNSINPILSETLYRAYPIPTAEQLYIETKLPAQLRLSDLQGKTCWEQSVAIGTNTCPTDQLPAGLYLLHIITTQGAATLRVVVGH